MQILLEGVHCTACGSAGTLESPDAARDRRRWPLLGCFFTPLCPGQVVPDDLN